MVANLQNFLSFTNFLFKTLDSCTSDLSELKKRVYLEETDWKYSSEVKWYSKTALLQEWNVSLG